MDLDADRKAFLDAGHALISEGLVAAHAVADANPRLPFKTLVMSIEGTLRGFFNHLMDVGKDAALAAEQTAEKDLGEQASIPVIDAAAAEIAAKVLAASPPSPVVAAKPLDPDTVGAPPVKDPTLKVQG